MRARSLAATVALSALLSCLPWRPARETPLVPLAHIDGSILTDLRYAGSDNFVGEPIDGYAAPRCLLTREAAEALSAVQRALRPRGLSLQVFDCYRPQRAVDHFVRWAAEPGEETRAAHYPRVEKSRLIELGYIADRSSHSRGSTVDVTLARRREDGSWHPLDMGTPFDFFDALSHTDAPGLTARQRRNRRLLVDAMAERGFRNLPLEWWHYTLDGEPYPDRVFDVEIRWCTPPSGEYESGPACRERP